MPENAERHDHEAHHHADHRHATVSGTRLLLSVLLNLVITVAEVIGGLASGSLALISDAAHNFGDGVSLIISYAAHRLSLRAGTHERTFGYKRAEILAALFNAVLLIVIVVFLMREAFLRLRAPVPIRGGIMLIVAVIGLAANLLAVLLLHRDVRASMNVRSAYLHLVADTLSSVGVIIGGGVIYLFGLHVIDPILTALISSYVLRECYLIVKQTVNILMQGTPGHIDIGAIKCALEELPEVANLHHVHVWQINERDVHLEAHVEICEDLPASRIMVLNRRIEQILDTRFRIGHVTIQIEYGACADRRVISSC